MKTTKTTYSTVLLGAGMVLLASGPLSAQSADREFEPFNKFVERTAAMDSREASRLAGPSHKDAAIAEMREHVLKTYRGVEVSHSFVLGSSHFDCVPALQQPTAKAFGMDRIAAPPPQSFLARPAEAPDATVQGAVTAAAIVDREKSTDDFGNSVRCDDGSVPMRRVTVEDLAAFSTLDEFFRKGPEGAGQASQADAPPAVDLSGHKYSHMYQIVNNLGGNSNLNIWSPFVDTARGQDFSLSQEWYVGGSGAAMQTVEVGWQNYPKLYGNQKSRLFIYWTADNYKSTGCYNLDCPAFVQVNSSVALGSDFGSDYSKLGGQQYDFSAQYLLYQGNWWLSIQGTWVGYYPGSLYRGGQLTKFAQQVQYGTESTGKTVWPGEGSGEWSTTGWTRAAYQRNLFHFGTDGAAVPNTLTQWISSPNCYNVSGPFTSKSAGWNVYFYQGGPGGAACQ